MDLKSKLIALIQNGSEIEKCMNDLNLHLRETFQECHDYCFKSGQVYEDVLLLKIDSILDYLHDELNTGHWSEVPVTTRQTFTCVSFIKALVIVSSGADESVRNALKCVDLGLLLGAPLSENCGLMTQAAALFSESMSKPSSVRVLSKRKLPSNLGRVHGKEVPVLHCPSIEHFNENHFKPCYPAVLKDCISHWPAVTKWPDVNYLLELAGSRTVPIEIGSHYADENWTQKLMSLREFIYDHYLDSSSLGYLAQHNLFDQIPELREDIRVPDYCALAREEGVDPDVNAWLGPEGTVSPLHFDPKDNLLTQVYGTKEVVLFAPCDSERLYPHEGSLLFNTAQVDPYAPDLDKFPKYRGAGAYKCMLEAGDMLYIPLRWWHHVSALEKSFSVSFWWS
ncbi:hypothetical protein PPYR_14217 [Photinus pyralis]|uniref:JmjC domain-containing protein n=2 Tax=Photinus pyralis TaxID=7054 RepID=A0A5N4A4P2_PHOPY|nr:bifunctional peptidase and arginyl-hydroxylase JMJD5 [Photinus pyralis]KAB0792258.1 hypothetical protein PPYR_14217 [Photinus pyralis]